MPRLRRVSADDVLSTVTRVLACVLVLGALVVGIMWIPHILPPPKNRPPTCEHQRRAPPPYHVYAAIGDGSEDSTLKVVPHDDAPTVDASPATYRHVVLLTRWENVGQDRFGNRNDVEFMKELVRRHALYFPRGTSLMVASHAKSTEELVTITGRALHQGERIFVGALTSGDLLALKPLAQEFPDALFISTASTAPALALPDNMFRLACPDQRTVQYMGALLKHTFPSTTKWIIQYDAGSKWATQLHDMLRFHLDTDAEVQMVHNWHQVDARKVASHAHHLGFMSITERDEASLTELRAQPWFEAHLGKATPLVFADASAFSHSWGGKSVFFDTPMPIYAFTSLKMLASITIARNVLGRSVGPFLANLLLAGRLGVQGLILAHNLQDSKQQVSGRKVIQWVAQSRHTATGTGMFDDNGDRADIEVGIVAWEPHHADWRIVTTAGNHHALGPFDATFHKQE